MYVLRQLRCPGGRSYGLRILKPFLDHVVPEQARKRPLGGAGSRQPQSAMAMGMSMRASAARNEGVGRACSRRRAEG